MKKQTIFLLVFLTFLSFSNSLNNDFIGDSLSIFRNNSFYKHPAHLKYLFSRQLIMAPEQYQPRWRGEENFYSGLISYRPVTALTFFTDYALYRDNPLGFHLTNILLHLVAVGLVFSLAWSLLPNPAFAFMAALLFGVHPIQSEAVTCIGYRSDLLATLLTLAALLAYRRAESPVPPSGKFLAASLAAFGFALLSKETAMVFIPLLVLYDGYMFKPVNQSWVSFFRYRWKKYGMYAFILLAYLIVYSLLFPSQHYPKYFLPSVGIASPGWVALKIFFEYLKVFFLPVSVTVLPPLYTPRLASGDIIGLAAMAALAAAGVVAVFRGRKRYPLAFFAVAWFVITYLPASNIIWLPNPIAFRFMYLPAVGVSLLLALWIERAARYWQSLWPSSRAGLIFKAALIGVCMAATFGNNGFFKNNFSACLEMIRNYPDSSRPYWILGLNYYEQAQFDKAKYYFEEYARKDPRNPFVPAMKDNFLLWHSLGRCCVRDPIQAARYFEKTVQLRPDFLPAHIDLAKTYILQNNYPNAASAALKAIRLDATVPLSYVYAIHAYIGMGDIPAARRLLTAVEGFAWDDTNVRYVSRLLQERSEYP
ncbi:MAG TPA: hypothetical protein PLB05_04805 [Candidatus Omnitrophota bacterium]|nr:hypothetical protein [Candidatus Omnitrophota bacterium]